MLTLTDEALDTLRADWIESGLWFHDDETSRADGIIERIRAAGGSDWDRIDDPVAFLGGSDNLPEPPACRTCDGDGWTISTDPDGDSPVRRCPDCQGRRADPDETPLEIEVPIVVTDDDGATDSAEPVEVPDDVFDRDALTLLQHDAVEYLLRHYPAAEVSGRSVWIPRTRTGPMPVSTPDGYLLLHTEPTVFRAGCWVDLDHATLTGG